MSEDGDYTPEAVRADLLFILEKVGWCMDVIAISARDREMQDWCTEHVGPQAIDGRTFEESDWVVVCQDNRTIDRVFFAFRRPKDAVAFKLRWC